MTVKPGASVEEPRQRLAAGPHPLLAVRRAFVQRLITQMYFPGDPLFAYDPILQSVPEAAWERLVPRLDMDLTSPEWALGYRWDIVLRGRQGDPDGGRGRRPMSLPETPSQTIGPFFAVALPWADGPDVVPEGTPGAIRIGGRVLDGAGDPAPDASSRPGRPTRRAASPTPTTRAGRPPRGSAASGAARPTPRAPTTRTSPGLLPAPDGGGGSACGRGGFARGPLNRPDPHLLPGRGRGQRRRPPAGLDPGLPRPAWLVATAGPDGLRFDVRLQGDQETLPCHLTAELLGPLFAGSRADRAD